MPNIKFDMTISLGSIGTFVLVALAVIGNYVSVVTTINTVREKVETVEIRMNATDKRIEKVEDFTTSTARLEADRNASLSNRLTGLEAGQATTVTTLQDIRQELRDRRVDRNINP